MPLCRAEQRTVRIPNGHRRIIRLRTGTHYTHERSGNGFTDRPGICDSDEKKAPLHYSRHSLYPRDEPKTRPKPTEDEKRHRNGQCPDGYSDQPENRRSPRAVLAAPRQHESGRQRPATPNRRIRSRHAAHAVARRIGIEYDPGHARMGVRTGYVGKVGRDTTGDFFEQALVNLGIEPHILRGNERSAAASRSSRPTASGRCALFSAPRSRCGATN